MITELTREQEQGIIEWQTQCLKIGRDTSPINKQVIERAWGEFYKILKYSTPLFWYCQSPLQAQIIMNIFQERQKFFNIKYSFNIGENIGENIRQNIGENIRGNIWQNIGENIRGNIWQNIGENIWQNIRGNIWQNIRENIRQNIGENIGEININYITTYLWGQHDISWIAYCKYFERFGLLPNDKNFEIFNIWYDLACSCGWCYAFEKMVFVCEKPLRLFLNNQGRLHNEKNMALEYSDGYGLWMLNGIRVTKELVITPAEKLDPTIIIKESNVDIRREIVRKIGIERIYQKLNVKVLDTFKIGTNLNIMFDVYELIDLGLGQTYRPYLKMTNASMGIYHIEGVSSECKTAEQAFNWRYKNKFKPEQIRGIA